MNVKADDPAYNEGLQEGIRAGKMAALETNQRAHADWLKHLDKRMQIQERITYGLLGVIAFIEFWPSLEQVLSK